MRRTRPWRWINEDTPRGVPVLVRSVRRTVEFYTGEAVWGEYAMPALIEPATRRQIAGACVGHGWLYPPGHSLEGQLINPAPQHWKPIA